MDCSFIHLVNATYAAGRFASTDWRGAPPNPFDQSPARSCALGYIRHCDVMRCDTVRVRHPLLDGPYQLRGVGPRRRDGVENPAIPCPTSAARQAKRRSGLSATDDLRCGITMAVALRTRRPADARLICDPV